MGEGSCDDVETFGDIVDSPLFVRKSRVLSELPPYNAWIIPQDVCGYVNTGNAGRYIYDSRDYANQGCLDYGCTGLADPAMAESATFDWQSTLTEDNAYQQASGGGGRCATAWWATNITGLEGNTPGYYMHVTGTPGCGVTGWNPWGSLLAAAACIGCPQLQSCPSPPPSVPPPPSSDEEEPCTTTDIIDFRRACTGVPDTSVNTPYDPSTGEIRFKRVMALKNRFVDVVLITEPGYFMAASDTKDYSGCWAHQNTTGVATKFVSTNYTIPIVPIKIEIRDSETDELTTGTFYLTFLDIDTRTWKSFDKVKHNFRDQFSIDNDQFLSYTLTNTTSVVVDTNASNVSTIFRAGSEGDVKAPTTTERDQVHHDASVTLLFENKNTIYIRAGDPILAEYPNDKQMDRAFMLDGISAFVNECKPPPPPPHSPPLPPPPSPPPSSPPPSPLPSPPPPSPPTPLAPCSGHQCTEFASTTLATEFCATQTSDSQCRVSNEDLSATSDGIIRIRRLDEVQYIYEIKPTNTLCSDHEGATHIESMEECTIASAYVGRNLIATSPPAFQFYLPRGCFETMATDPFLFWSSTASGEGNRYIHSEPLCRVGIVQPAFGCVCPKIPDPFYATICVDAPSNPPSPPPPMSPCSHSTCEFYTTIEAAQAFCHEHETNPSKPGECRVTENDRVHDSPDSMVTTSPSPPPLSRRRRLSELEPEPEPEPPPPPEPTPPDPPHGPPPDPRPPPPPPTSPSPPAFPPLPPGFEVSTTCEYFPSRNEAIAACETFPGGKCAIVDLFYEFNTNTPCVEDDNGNGYETDEAACAALALARGTTYNGVLNTTTLPSNEDGTQLYPGVTFEGTVYTDYIFATVNDNKTKWHPGGTSPFYPPGCVHMAKNSFLEIEATALYMVLGGTAVCGKEGSEKTNSFGDTIVADEHECLCRVAEVANHKITDTIFKACELNQLPLPPASPPSGPSPSPPGSPPSTPPPSSSPSPPPSASPSPPPSSSPSPPPAPEIYACICHQDPSSPPPPLLPPPPSHPPPAPPPFSPSPSPSPNPSPRPSPPPMPPAHACVNAFDVHVAIDSGDTVRVGGTDTLNTNVALTQPHYFHPTTSPFHVTSVLTTYSKITSSEGCTIDVVYDVKIPAVSDFHTGAITITAHPDCGAEGACINIEFLSGAYNSAGECRFMFSAQCALAP